MNFTHLVDASQLQPPQIDLQAYSHYLIIVVLSDEMAEMVRQEVGFDLESAEKTLCWIIQPRHLKQAPSGSALGRIYQVLSRNAVFPNPDHSFIAWCSREDARVGSDHSGTYRELLLHDQPTADAAVLKLRTALAEALNSTEKESRSLAEISKVVGAFAKLIAELVGLYAAGARI